MFKITARSFRYENLIISASLDLIIEDKILIFDEEWSLTDTLPRLLDTILEDHQIKKEPLFVCSCGNLSCDWADYNLKHQDKWVIITDFIRRGKKDPSLAFTLPFEEYSREIIKLAQELSRFEATLEKMISDATPFRYFEKREPTKERLKKLNLKFPQFFKEGEPLDPELEIRQTLQRISIPEAIEITRQYPWKIGEIINCLYDLKESIRYLSAEALGVIADQQAVEPLIEKLLDESEPVRYMTIKSLSKMGYLHNLEFMDELFLPRFWGRDCRKGRYGWGEKTRGRDGVTPLLALLEESSEGVVKRAFKTLEKLDLKKDKRISEKLDKLLLNKNIAFPFRLQSMKMLKLEGSPQAIFSLLSILEDKGEVEEARSLSLNLLSECSDLEVLEAMKRIREDSGEKESLRKKVSQILTKKEVKKKFASPRLLTFSAFLLGIIIIFLLGALGAPLLIQVLLGIGLFFFLYWILSKP